jgi:phosphoglycolate phosphatase
MISTIVFDFDGTLVDSNAIKRQAFFDLVDAHGGGRARMEAVLARVEGDRHAVLAAYLADSAVPGETMAHKVDALVRAYSDHVDACVAAAVEMPGATSLLRQLRRHGKRVFLSSATPVASLRSVLERRDWMPYFDHVFGHPSDKRDTLMRVQALCGTGAESLAVVGDGADDRASAASVGCAFFPVGEARGAVVSERVFTLTELVEVLLDRTVPST